MLNAGKLQTEAEQAEGNTQSDNSSILSPMQIKVINNIPKAACLHSETCMIHPVHCV